MDWATSDHRPPTRVAAAGPALVHTYWHLLNPHDRELTCGLYRTSAGYFEVRAAYTLDEVIRTQVVRSRDAGDDVAAIWKMAALEKGFRERPPAA